jgi:acyltransferase
MSEPTARPDVARNPTIDTVRGLLLIVVMAGHTFTVPVVADPLKWAIYSFHMPLFFGLSGYLFNVEGVRRLDWRGLFRKYGMRMLIAWALAMLVYLVLVPPRMDPGGLIRIVTRPYSHLWFVPVFFAYIVAAWLIPVSRRTLFLIALAVSSIGMAGFGVGHFGGDSPGWLPDERYFTYPVFFFLGVMLRGRELAGERQAPWETFVALAAAVGGYALYQWCFFHPARWTEIVAFLLANLALVSLLPILLARHIDLPGAREIGEDSLFFYLWHPALFLLAKPLHLHPLLLLAAAIAILFAVRAILRRNGTASLLTGLVRPQAVPRPVPGNAAQ